ncbi:ribosome maturation factor RimM [Propionibacteriaceae bacterium Y1923]|uniref:ribosome maturation factor RimM n=1 Tax=Aestuariimicrobium sp. Y1814 TaxID=3418742 RepID=UPI003C1F6B8A
MPRSIEVTIGVVGRAHGIRGDVMIDLRTDEPERRFATGAVVRVEGSRRTLTVTKSAWHGGRLMVHFQGMDDRNAAEAARGTVLVCDVDPAELPEEDDEYYDRQLVGLQAVLADGTVVGEVSQVVHLPAQDLLVIDVDGEERMVPFVTELVPRVDLAAGEVELVAQPGLLADEGDDDGDDEAKGHDEDAERGAP